MAGVPRALARNNETSIGQVMTTHSRALVSDVEFTHEEGTTLQECLLQNSILAENPISCLASDRRPKGNSILST